MTLIGHHLVASTFAAWICVTVAVSTPVHAADAKALVVEEIQVTDASKYKEYVDQAGATVASFGGVFITRGGTVDVIAGSPPAGRVVIIEFPSMAKAKAWHESDAYQKILPIRNASSTSRVYLVEGVAP